MYGARTLLAPLEDSLEFYALSLSLLLLQRKRVSTSVETRVRPRAGMGLYGKAVHQPQVS